MNIDRYKVRVKFITGPHAAWKRERSEAGRWAAPALLILASVSAGMAAWAVSALTHIPCLALGAAVVAWFVVLFGVAPFMRAGQTSEYRDDGSDGQWWSH